jgi:multicomponent Na+:H+ antiporter subunit D
MRPIVESYPFFCIFLAIVFGIVSSVIKNGKFTYFMSLFTAITIAVMSAMVLYYVVQGNLSFDFTMGRFPAPYGNVIRVGPLQALLALAFSTVMALSLMGGKQDLFRDILPDKLHLYFVMIDLLLASLLAFCYTNDFFTGYVFIEISTISACAIVMAKDTGNNLIATIRYLFISLIGSGLFLIGLTLLYSITGYLLMPQLKTAVAALAASGTYNLPLTVSIAMIIIGLGIKSAMFPFHLWLPEAHGGATTASSSILSGLVLKGYIVLMIVLITRVFSLELMVKLGVTNIILIFGILGMIFGSLEAIREHHIKRMLAYSSVAQIGYIFLGIGLGSVPGIVAACFHILVHACSKPLLFCCAGRLSGRN